MSLLLIFTVSMLFSLSVEGGTYESMVVDGVNTVVMKLIVRPKGVDDFGAYKCIARNAVGETEKLIYLHRE